MTSRWSRSLGKWRHLRNGHHLTQWLSLLRSDDQMVEAHEWGKFNTLCTYNVQTISLQHSEGSHLKETVCGVPVFISKQEPLQQQQSTNWLRGKWLRNSWTSSGSSWEGWSSSCLPASLLKRSMHFFYTLFNIRSRSSSNSQGGLLLSFKCCENWETLCSWANLDLFLS